MEQDTPPVGVGTMPALVAGVGTDWIASGLLPRTDVAVAAVEDDPQAAALAALGDWPSFVGLRHGGALDVLTAPAGSSDLIFADAPRRKWERLGQTFPPELATSGRQPHPVIAAFAGAAAGHRAGTVSPPNPGPPAGHGGAPPPHTATGSGVPGGRV